MKSFIRIIALLILSSCCVKQINDKPLEEVLKGKVSSIVECYYNAAEKFGEVQKDGLIIKYLKKYDRKGNILEETMYNDDESIRYTEKWKYNAIGKIEEHFIYRSHGLDQRDLYKYNEHGYVIEHITEYPTTNNNLGVIHSNVYKYDNKGNLVDQIWHVNGNFANRYVFKYDKDGNKIEVVNCGIDGDVSYKAIYKYNTRGQKMEYYDYNSHGNLEKKETYKYDNRGNLVAESFYESSGAALSTSSTRREYSYNSKCQLIGGKYIDSNDNILSHGTIKYDEHGFIIETSEIKDNKEEEIMNYEYSDFDSEGNWLKKKESKNGKLEKIGERVIGYFTD